MTLVYKMFRTWYREMIINYQISALTLLRLRVELYELLAISKVTCDGIFRFFLMSILFKVFAKRLYKHRRIL